MAMNPLIPLAGAGALLLLLTSKSKASPATTTPGVPATPGSGTPNPGTPGTITTPPSGPSYYTVETGDYPARIAQKITGDSGRWQELVRANPSKAVWTSAEIAAAKAAKTTLPGSAQAGNFKTLYAGEKLILPESW